MKKAAGALSLPPLQRPRTLLLNYQTAQLFNRSPASHSTHLTQVRPSIDANVLCDSDIAQSLTAIAPLCEQDRRVIFTKNTVSIIDNTGTTKLFRLTVFFVKITWLMVLFAQGSNGREGLGKITVAKNMRINGWTCDRCVE